jgi:hypothetical protein
VFKDSVLGPGSVAHSYLGGGDRRIEIQGKPGRKVSETLSQNISQGLGLVTQNYITKYLGGRDLKYQGSGPAWEKKS